jgi:hypothetical protein
MNEIFENNSVITRAYNFYNTYRALIIGITAVVVISISVFLLLIKLIKQIMKRLQKYTMSGHHRK